MTQSPHSRLPPDLELPNARESLDDTVATLASLAGARAWVVCGSEIRRLTSPDGGELHPPGGLASPGLLAKMSADPTDLSIVAAARRACESGTRLEETGLVAVPWRVAGRAGAYVIVGALGVGLPFLERTIARAQEWARGDAVMDALGEGMVVATAGGAITAVTRRAAVLLGTVPEALEGRRLGEVAPWIGPLEVGEIVRGAWPDRPAYVLAHHAAPAPGGEQVGEPGLLIRLRSEDQFATVRQRQQQLLSILRHDVRSPLTSVRGLVGVLLDEPDMPRDERLSLLELLRQEAERTVTWVEDYLVTLRLRLEPRPQHTAACDLVATLGTLERFFSRHADDRQITFTVMPFHADGRRAEVVAEPSLLESFAKNLVGHAFRLADAGAAISVRLDPHDLALEVRGSGPGLFHQTSRQPFTTLARSTAAGKRTPGVGLGLFLTKKIADAHGWRLVLHQDASEGLVVRVEWQPTARAEPDAPSAVYEGAT